MSDGLPDRLAQLRARWEADPASRVFLQLAEEYRHLGRVSEALAVLDAGLREHPGYLSALVAKGRCLLELAQPEAARDVLERVVKQDATQMVANKLLVRAYLETGQADRAGERLDLYMLLHESDPEVEELRRRIRGEELRGTGAIDPPEPAVAPVFAPPPPPVPAAAGDDVFSLEPPARSTPAEDVFELAPPPPPPPARPMAQSAALTDLEDAADEPFPELSSTAVRRRYLQALAADGLFDLGDLGLAPAAPATTSWQAADDVFDLSPEPVQPAAAFEPAEPVFELTPEPEFDLAPEPEFDLAPEPGFDLAPEPGFDLAPEPGLAPALPAELPVPAVASPFELAPEPGLAPTEAEEEATVTLAQLYLRQGHRGEAERMFREVLRREPGNPAARAALAQIARDSASSPVPLTAAELLRAFPGGDPRARRVHLLHGYLARLRRGSAPRVS